jgi:hypothetical protein
MSNMAAGQQVERSAALAIHDRLPQRFKQFGQGRLGNGGQTLGERSVARWLISA